MATPEGSSQKKNKEKKKQKIKKNLHVNIVELYSKPSMISSPLAIYNKPEEVSEKLIFVALLWKCFVKEAFNSKQLLQCLKYDTEYKMSSTNN